MTNTRSSNCIFNLTVSSMREIFDAAMTCCIENATPFDEDDSGSDDSNLEPTPAVLDKAMQQFFDVISTISKPSENNLAEKDMEGLSTYGISLLEKASICAQQLDCEESVAIFEQLAIPVAIWAAQHDIIINSLEPIVNAVSNIANHTEDTNYLTELIDAIDIIAKTVSPDLKADIDKSSPWRILNLNQGIIAARAQDAGRMEAIFEQLMYRLPDEVAVFFAEGMAQMDRIDYPEHVREVIQKYYHLTNKPTLH